MDSRHHLIRSMLIAALVAATPASAANLLSNGEFSNFTVSPWVASQGSVYLSNLDHAGDLDSGSALVVDSNGSLIAASFLSECVQIQGSAQADVSAWLKGGTKVPAGSKVRIGRFYYADASCGGSSYISGANGGFQAVPSGWTRLAQAHTSPANAQSVRVEIVANSGDNSNFELLVDGVALEGVGEAVPPSLFASDFENGNLADWTVNQ